MNINYAIVYICRTPVVISNNDVSSDQPLFYGIGIASYMP